jgi:hypothetical protein
MSDLAPAVLTPSSFRDIIDLWPSPDEMAAELEAGRWTVPKWKTRNSIPAEWWQRLLKTERAKSHGVTADLLTELASREIEEARA